jgi:Fur family peroxide stress response transcriptional regulator
MVTIENLETRQTKYCKAIKNSLKLICHATNKQLLAELRISFPDLSATTVHRATSRLAVRGEIGLAPATKDGSMRYDANIKPHDHFLCNNCNVLRDTDIMNKITPILESYTGDCQISGRLTISGTCKNCIKLNGEEYV